MFKFIFFNTDIIVSLVLIAEAFVFGILVKFCDLWSPPAFLLRMKCILACLHIITLLVVLSEIVKQNFLFWLLDLFQYDSYFVLKLCTFWLLSISIVLKITSFSRFKSLSRTCKRKIFHILVVIMFCYPTTVLVLNQPLVHTFMVLAYGVAISALIHLEVLRCDATFSTIFPILKAVNRYFEEFESDIVKTGENSKMNDAISFSGSSKRPHRYITSHISLLLACALPMWLWGFLIKFFAHSADSLIFSSHNKMVFSTPIVYTLLPHLGYVTVGIGDTVAAIVGSTCGRRPWSRNSKKTVEGSVAAFIVIVAVLYFILDIHVKDPTYNFNLSTSMDPWQSGYPSMYPEVYFAFSNILKTDFWCIIYIALIACIVEAWTNVYDDNITMIVAAILAMITSPFFFDLCFMIHLQYQLWRIPKIELPKKTKPKTK